MTDHLARLQGPHRQDAVELIQLAHDMRQEDAERLALNWALDDMNLEAYYSACDRVWNALEESGRFLQVGWFEKEFADAPWMVNTKALHPIADAVCATLVMDQISDDDYQLMTRHTRNLFQFA